MRTCGLEDEDVRDFEASFQSTCTVSNFISNGFSERILKILYGHIGHKKRNFQESGFTKTSSLEITFKLFIVIQG